MTTEDVIEAEAEEEIEYDDDTKKISLKNRKVTKMKSNRRIKLPDPIEDEKEHDLLRLKRVVNEETLKYMKENCDASGKDKNETKSEDKISGA